MRGLDWIDRCCRVLVAAGILTMLLAVGGEVILRLVFGVSFGGTSEIARFAFVWLTFLGSTCAFRQRCHLSINLLADLLTPRWAKVLDTLLCLLILIACYYLLVHGLAQTQRNWTQTSPTLGVRMGLIYAAIPVSAALIIVYAISDLFRQSGEIWRGEDHKPIGNIERESEDKIE